MEIFNKEKGRFTVAGMVIAVFLLLVVGGGCGVVATLYLNLLDAVIDVDKSETVLACLTAGNLLLLMALWFTFRKSRDGDMLAVGGWLGGIAAYIIGTLGAIFG